MICSYNEPPFDGLAVDLVFNGDLFDLLKTSYLGAHPRHITSEVARGKMAAVASAHAAFFAGLRAFLDHDGAERRGRCAPHGHVGVVRTRPSARYSWDRQRSGHL